MLKITRKIGQTIITDRPCSITVVSRGTDTVTLSIEPREPVVVPACLICGSDDHTAAVCLQLGQLDVKQALTVPAKTFGILPSGEQVYLGTRETVEVGEVEVTPESPIDRESPETRHKRMVDHSTEGPGAGSPAGRGPSH